MQKPNDLPGSPLSQLSPLSLSVHPAEDVWTGKYFIGNYLTTVYTPPPPQPKASLHCLAPGGYIHWDFTKSERPLKTHCACSFQLLINHKVLRITTRRLRYFLLLLKKTARKKKNLLSLIHRTCATLKIDKGTVKLTAMTKLLKRQFPGKGAL